MSEYVQFEATTPIVEAATSEKVYDKYWMANFRIEAGRPEQPVRLMAAFVPARDITETDPETGVVTVVGKEIQKNAQPKRLVIQDLFGEAAADPSGLGTVLNGVLTFLKDRAVAEGVI